MPIRFRCESCESRIKVPDGAEGRRVRCPRCGHLQRVPEPGAELELSDTPPNAPPSPEEESLPPPPPPMDEPDQPDEAIEPAAADELAQAPSDDPAPEPAATATAPDEDAAAPADSADDVPSEESSEEEEHDAPQEPAPEPAAPEPAAAEQLELDTDDSNDAPAPADASLFDRAQAESRGVPERLEEGTAITAMDVIGRGSRDVRESDRPEPPSQLMATAAPKPAPRPRATPKAPPSIPLGGAASGPSSPPNEPNDRTSAERESAGGNDHSEARPAGGLRLAPRHPSMPPPPTPAYQPPPTVRRGESGPLTFLPTLLRIIAMLLIVAGIVHVVQLLGVTTRIAALFVYAVVWLAAAGITWTVGEIAAAVDRQRH